ncbi:hypothetical protein F5148DRAFT_428569 [Russula earlei]|uniref:Uncharacterized protein n=1 Tax=Russula earlei TaxID=71964 RepID=A0ACC0TZ13_9AGAM|nr:hypothetical protein F5148DRAFT_428569 [Russula earlei]
MTGISKAIWPPHHDVACATGKMSFSITAVSERYADPLYVYAAYPMKIATSCSGSDSTRTTARRFHDDSTPGAWTSDEKSISTSERYSTPLSTSALKTLATSMGTPTRLSRRRRRRLHLPYAHARSSFRPYVVHHRLRLTCLVRRPCRLRTSSVARHRPSRLPLPSSLRFPHLQPCLSSPHPRVPPLLQSPSPSPHLPCLLPSLQFRPPPSRTQCRPLPHLPKLQPCLPRPPSLLLPLSFQSRPPSYLQHRQPPPRC